MQQMFNFTSDTTVLEKRLIAKSVALNHEKRVEKRDQLFLELSTEEAFSLCPIKD